MSEKGGRLVLIDSYGLIYRAYFALPPLMNSKGQHTNAVLGFTTMLARIISDEKPTYLIAAFDRGRPQARMDRYAEYKAHREEMPDELRSQIPLVRRVLETYGIPILEQEGEEADDILATLAAKAEGAHEVRIITGDLDLLQCVDDRTTVVVTRRGIGEMQAYDTAAVFERFGLSPRQLPDYRGLKGDPSDNLPGIPGIGEKTAIKLIASAGSLDALLADPSKAGTAKLEALLREHAEIARTCRDISVADRALPVEVPWDDARFTLPSIKQLVALYRELDFKQLLAKLDPRDVLEDAAGAAENPGEPASTVEGTYRHFGHAENDDQVALVDALRKLQTSERLAFVRRETELGIAWAQGEALAFDVAALQNAEVRGLVLGLIARVPQLVAHDAKALFAELRHAVRARAGDAPLRTAGKKSKAAAANQAGLFDLFSGEQSGEPGAAVAGDLSAGGASEIALCAPRLVADDTMVAAYVLNTTKAYLSAAEAISDVLETLVPPETAAWADGVFRAASAARVALVAREQLGLYEDVELPAVTLLAEMEAAGVALDRAELARLAVDIDADVERTREMIFTLAGEDFNLGSPQQLGRILFEKLKLPGGKRNKTGYATGVDVLTALAAEHEIAAGIINYREVAKLKNTYVDVLPTLLDSDGRLRTIFNQTSTATGRVSSTNPNLQNIPVRGELGRRIRKAFVVGSSDRILLAADYSQIELRLMAHLSSDDAMRGAFLAGHDIHDETARKIFNVTEGVEVDREQRRIAKSVNFGLLYGMGEFGLAQRLGIARDEARQLVEAYFGQFPGVRGYLDSTIAFGREHGYVQTIAGRRRYLPDLRSRDHNARAAAEREATNAPLQGGAADLVKIAMLRVANALRDTSAQMLLQIHDELILEVPQSELRSIATIVRNEMSKAMELSVPLEVTVKTGATWYDVATYADEQEPLVVA